MDKASVFQNLGKRLFKILAKDCSKSWQKIVQIHQKNLGMGQTSPLLGGAKIAAVVLHTMNIEGQIHQKKSFHGSDPPFLAMPGFWKRLALQPLPYRTRGSTRLRISEFLRTLSNTYGQTAPNNLLDVLVGNYG